MQEIDDKGYRQLFSNKEIFRQLMTTLVHEGWVKELDFSRCELVKGSFVSRNAAIAGFGMQTAVSAMFPRQ